MRANKKTSLYACFPLKHRQKLHYLSPFVFRQKLYHSFVFSSFPKILMIFGMPYYYRHPAGTGEPWFESLDCIKKVVHCTTLNGSGDRVRAKQKNKPVCLFFARTGGVLDRPAGTGEP